MITKEHVEQLRAALESARVEPGYFIDGVVVIPESLARAWMQIADEAIAGVGQQLEDRGEVLILRSRVAELERDLAGAKAARVIDDMRLATANDEADEGRDRLTNALSDVVKLGSALLEIRELATRAYETGEALSPSEIALKCKEALG